MEYYKRQKIRVEGIVQGVGFRPFVYRLAKQRNLSGLVFNDSHGVQIEIEGSEALLSDFLQALQLELPALASISALDVTEQPLQAGQGFSIIESATSCGRTAQIAPDSYVCDDCLKELFDPQDRRYKYPFINCTNCGPRYTIVTDIPYDRPKTTMADFPMCPTCHAEYTDPASRRFHAQPNACADCGPQVSFVADGQNLFGSAAIAETIARLKQGQVVAIKGVGGYHLAVDATNDVAVARLRLRKQRDEKPFAVMSFDLPRIREFAQVSVLEERLLSGVERPIVLLAKNDYDRLSPYVAPNNKYVGVMLPYAPLHYLLLKDFSALVMTSGNQSDEPIAFENNEAQVRLQTIADCYLLHDRRIHIRTDDSIVRLLDGQPVLYRRSRGYVPRAVKLPAAQPAVLALGAELKSCICLTRSDQAFMSQHIGDLKNQQVVDSLRQTIRHQQNLLEVTPQLIAHDLHPDYLSTQVAKEIAGELPLVAVQHHHAHLASCLVDNGRSGPAIGVIFDGIGYGSDGHIWGGEFLIGDLQGFERVAQLKYLPMPGGDAATKEPWRMALSYLHAAFGDDIPELPFLQEINLRDRNLLLQMMQKNINSPLTSSAGRLFDAVAALLGLRNRVSYEGQAALELEMQIDAQGVVEAGYRFSLLESAGPLQIDAAPLIKSIVSDLHQGVAVARISARFHNGLAEMIVALCRRFTANKNTLPVVLSGGVFQNRYLTERTAKLLRDAGFEVLLHRQVPPNDGGLALGQAAVAGANSA